ncbi:MAG: ABC-F family ATP-binding cassette domain-containing protein [Ferrimicrobium sp.]
MLNARSIHLELGARVLFHDVSLLVDRNDRIGLVGRNGAGKTTLLRILANELESLGSIERLGTIGYLPQDPRVGDPKTTALARILSGRGLDSLHDTMIELQYAMSATNGAELRRATADYGDVELQFAARDGYRAESQAATIAEALGLPSRVLHQELSTLSGGQRRRIELARILFSDADLLLLDEPTNHLDADSVAWLRTFLANFSGAVIVISHDVELLEAVATKIAYLDATRGELDHFAMGYSAYLVARSQDEARRKKERESTLTKATHLQHQADRMRGSSAKRARVAKVLDRRAGRLLSHLDNRPMQERVANLRFPNPLPCGRTPLAANGLSKAYGSLEVLSAIDLVIDRGSKVVILGLNGAGKTTLMRLLAGVEAPDTGVITAGTGVRIGYYAQEHEMLDPNATVIENLRRSAPPDITDSALRGVLGSFLFPADVLSQQTSTLSGGEKTRLALATLVSQRCNLLLLDEPTNNLDPASRDRILSALASYDGATILVTHDPGAVEALNPERVLLLPDGTEDYWSPDLLDLVTLS